MGSSQILHGEKRAETLYETCHLPELVPLQLKAQPSGAPWTLCRRAMRQESAKCTLTASQQAEVEEMRRTALEPPAEQSVRKRLDLEVADWAKLERAYQRAVDALVNPIAQKKNNSFALEIMWQHAITMQSCPDRITQIKEAAL